jgi:hypothetical protein
MEAADDGDAGPKAEKKSRGRPRKMVNDSDEQTKVSGPIAIPTNEDRLVISII